MAENAGPEASVNGIVRFTELKSKGKACRRENLSYPEPHHGSRRSHVNGKHAGGGQHDMNRIPEFCTCSDLTCPNHPANSENGCTACIEKNLKAGEIPTCFFKNEAPDYKGPGYKTEDFARLVMKRRKPE